jgi:hypothetical protein
MKVVGIHGSQRKGGNSEILLKVALAKAREREAVLPLLWFSYFFYTLNTCFVDFHISLEAQEECVRLLL